MGIELPPKPEAPKEEVMTLRGVDVKMVLCMDTLGTNEALPEEKIPQLMDICNACGECKAAYEMRQVDRQVLFRMDDEKRESLDNDIAAATEEEAKELQEAYDAEKLTINEMPAPEEEGVTDFKALYLERLEKKHAYLKARALL